VTAVLTVDGVTKRFGGLVAVNEVSFELGERELVGLIGPNGSGKSTLLNVLSGVYRPDGGQVVLFGQKIHRQAPSSIAAAGMSRTFQHLRLFDGLTVLENVLVGRNARLSSNIAQVILGTRTARREERRVKEEGLELLAQVGLADEAHLYPASLSYGRQRLLEIARALAVEPKVIMLDEPVAGLSAGEATALADLIRRLAESGVSILLVEHNMRFVMSLVHRLIVLNFGLKIADGTPDEVRGNGEVISAYLGGSADARG
jgi:branched-chain amino acid transport system ATP-binding protein